MEKGIRQVVLIGGEPGSGKSRLVNEVARALHDDDVTVLVGTCGVEAGVPYQPFAEMLDHLFSTAPAGSLAGLLGDSAGELHRLSREVVRHDPGVATERTGPGEGRRELFEAVDHFFQGMATDRRLALIIEDLHWAQAPTLALLEHFLQTCTSGRLLVMATFRTTAPDRSEEVAARVAELHRLEGVRRLDLSGLDTEAIAELVMIKTGLPSTAARARAALLRDRTGGNPFFLRELWADMERRDEMAQTGTYGNVPVSLGETLAARLSRLDEEVRGFIELAAVLGDDFDLATVVSASERDGAAVMSCVDLAVAYGLIERSDREGRTWSFVHSLTREAVLERLPPSRRAALHARAARALEAGPHHPSMVARLAHHYLAADMLGYGDQALRYGREAAIVAEKSLAFEDAAAWYERAAGLATLQTATRHQLMLGAAGEYVKACRFAEARAIYEELAVSADGQVRLEAAMGYEDASWRPGHNGTRATDLLSAVFDDPAADRATPGYLRALGSLGRALALAGETARARQVGAQAISLAREAGDEATLLHVLSASLWHGTAPEVAQVQRERSSEAHRLAKQRRDFQTLGHAVNFRAMVSYMCGDPDDLSEAVSDSVRAAEGSGEPFYRYVHCCLAHADAFMRGDLKTAERWAQETLNTIETSGAEITEGPHSVQMFMLRRQAGSLEPVRRYISGKEDFSGRWVSGLLALYTELGLTAGVKRALRFLMDRAVASRTDDALWPMELAFMTEAALAVHDQKALATLRALLSTYKGMNLASGTLIAAFGSADRYLARVAAELGDPDAAEESFTFALQMDRRMGSVVHEAETLAYQAVFAAGRGREEQAAEWAGEAERLAQATGQGRILRIIGSVAGAAGFDGLSEREVAVLRLLAEGLSNSEIGARLYISPNTAANHVRSILIKTRSANRTQAAIYAAQRQLV